MTFAHEALSHISIEKHDLPQYAAAAFDKNVCLTSIQAGVKSDLDNHSTGQWKELAGSC